MSDDKRKSIRWRAWLFPWASLVYLTLILGLPTGGAIFLFRSAGSLGFLAVLFAPLVWVSAFLILAGVLSLPHQFSVVPGKVRRDVNDRMYFHRRLYGLCWTAVYYNKPAYYLCLSLPVLKWITFRLFGYRGSMNFTVYPDTWIRDLPVLHFEDGVYVSNRATLGTNIALHNGLLLVEGITLRSKALVGHLSMLAPGVELGPGAEIGVGGGIGIKTKLDAGAFVGPCSVIEHGVRLGRNASVGAHSYIGSRSTIFNDIKLPAGSVVAPRTTLKDAGDVTEDFGSWRERKFNWRGTAGYGLEGTQGGTHRGVAAAD
jgi:carbonic anhydrase/acetyltransferase-like protein (isoleucine patch superfamily)